MSNILRNFSLGIAILAFLLWKARSSESHTPMLFLAVNGLFLELMVMVNQKERRARIFKHITAAKRWYTFGYALMFTFFILYIVPNTLALMDVVYIKADNYDIGALNKVQVCLLLLGVFLIFVGF
jgi:hypothetical protein